jgi:transcriptional regulator with XRE-family HTH domain
MGSFLAKKGQPVADVEEWPPKEQFRDRLARLRKARGVSNDQIAEAAGVAINTVSNWMGSQVPEGQVLLDLATYFDVPPQWLLSGQMRRRAKKHPPTQEGPKRHVLTTAEKSAVAHKRSTRKGGG